MVAKFGVGQSLRRVEDQRFLVGSGRYVDDINRQSFNSPESGDCHRDAGVVVGVGARHTARAKVVPQPGALRRRVHVRLYRQYLSAGCRAQAAALAPAVRFQGE